MTARLLKWFMLVICVPYALARQDSDSGVNLTPSVLANAGPWQLGYLGCSHTSFNMDCRVTAINTGSSAELIRFVWKAPTSKSNTQPDASLLSHVTDPQGKHYWFGHVWAYTDIHKKGTEDKGSTVSSAEPNQRLYFQIILYGVPDEIIEMPSIALFTEVRDKKDHPGAIHRVNFENVPVVGINEDPNSAKNRFYRRFPYLRRWAFTSYIMAAIVAFFFHIRNRRFVVKTLSSYALNTLFLCLLVYASAYLMYSHPQSWQHGYEFSILPEKMSNGPTLPNEIPKGTKLYWCFLFMAVSLAVSFPQSVFYALAGSDVTHSAAKRIFFKLARWLGFGVCFIALIVTLTSTMNPYRSSNWFLMLICCVAIYGINRGVVADDLLQSICNYVPGGSESLSLLGRILNWLRKIGFF